jgi:hypothetical protein
MLNVSLNMVNFPQDMGKGYVDILYVIRDMIQVSMSMGCVSYDMVNVPMMW